ncbi:MAG: virulence RhuM family protein [Victivallales bacterium]|nr:virulence RhuM family protein [Victivallales bacterium]
MPESKNEIIVYQPDETIRLEVRLENDTVWLNRHQMAQLFGRDIKTIGKHIANALREELSEFSTGAKFATVENPLQNTVVAKIATTAADGKTYQIEYYSLDVILSVGYRVKSSQGVVFRRWATQVLKNYLTRGYAVNERLDRLETKVARHDEQIGLFLKTALPPVEGVLFEGQICDAYATALKLIKSAQKSLVLIDNYIDESVLTMLGARSPGVSAIIYTKHFSRKLRLDLQHYNAQYPPVVIKAYEGAHDRFLILDDTTVYHIGASLKDLGKSLFAFSRMEFPAKELLDRLP